MYSYAERLKAVKLYIKYNLSMLEEYSQRNGLIPFIHLSDDGYSGTNYNRPGWQELIAMVERDEVSTIALKDSSRIG